MTPGHRVLAIVACGAGPATALSTCVKLAQDRSWTVRVIATPAALEDVFHEPCLTGQFVGPRLSPEQYVCCSFLAHAGLDVPIETTRDLRFAPFATSMRCLLAAFDVFDERKCGIRLPPRMHAIIPSYECISEAGMRSLRAYWRSEPDAARDLHNTMMANMAALQHARDEAGYRTFA